MNDTHFSVEPKHEGREVNAVMYIPVGPDCPLNRVYVERMRFLFKKGLSPPDFTNLPEKEVNFKDRATLAALPKAASDLMGISEEEPES